MGRVGAVGERAQDQSAGAAAKMSNLVCSKGREKVSLASPRLMRAAQRWTP